MIDQHLDEFVETNLGDFFEFTITGPTERARETFTILRYSVEARLAGRSFDSFHLDIAIVEELDFAPERILTPALLSFADIDPIRVPTIPIEQHIADKVHAYSRIREGRLNTRVKDLVDLTRLASTPHVTFDSDQLARAISSIFRQEPTREIPESLSPPPPEWRDEFKNLASQVALETNLLDIDRAFELVRTRIDPALVDATRGRVDVRA